MKKFPRRYKSSTCHCGHDHLMHVRLWPLKFWVKDTHCDSCLCPHFISDDDEWVDTPINTIEDCDKS